MKIEPLCNFKYYVLSGLTHVEATVFSIVEIVHAFTVAEHNEAMSSLAAKVYLDLLLCPDHAVSFSAKHAIIRALRPRVKRRRVFIPSPPHASTPGELAVPNFWEQFFSPNFNEFESEIRV